MGFGVWNDFGRLREVAVGTAEGVVIPGCSEAFEPEHRELTGLYGGQRADDLPELRERMGKAQQQLDNLARLYAEHGVVVHRPRGFTAAESAYQAELQVGAMQMFPADPLWIVGRNVIECRFRQPFRNKERFTLRELMAGPIDENPEARVHACPTTTPSTGDYVLEGGDILLCGNEGKDVLVGVDEVRSSNARGVEWLRRQLVDDGFRVTPVPLRPGAPIHLLAALGVIGPEAALVYRPALLHGVPDPIKHWDLIDVTLEEVKAGGPCAVMLDPRTILMTAETPRLKDLLERRGLKVIPVPFDAVTAYDGAIRCATFVMRRDKE